MTPQPGPSCAVSLPGNFLAASWPQAERFMVENLLVAAVATRNFPRCNFISVEGCFFDVRPVYANGNLRYPSAESNLWCGSNGNQLILNGFRVLFDF